MNIRYRILDKNGRILFNNLEAREAKLIKEVDTKSKKLSAGKIRAGVLSNEYGTVITFSTNKDYLKSSSKFLTTSRAVLDSLEVNTAIISSARESMNQSTSRLIHNLTSLNAHNIQEIYSLIPQDKVSARTAGHRKFVESIIKESPKETASLLLRMAKNNAAMKAEFSVFRKLFESSPQLQRRKHNVHKVLMNIFYLFFPDFTDKEVKVIIGKSDYIAFFDYESIHVALYHLIDNAAKYIKPRTTLEIDIAKIEEHIEIRMSMISLEIRPDEVDRIFEEGVSGELARKMGKSGDGIGMNMAKQILKLNHGEIFVSTSKDIETFMGVNYQSHIFSIRLPLDGRSL